MRISFFEEFPTKENLEKLKLIDFPTKLYIASRSISEFKHIKINSRFVKEKVYWPLLSREDGYWLSPWAKRAALSRVIEEAKKNNIDVLWDAEYPSINKMLLLTQAYRFFSNKALIQNFITNYKGKVYTAEYLFEKGLLKHFLRFCALRFDPNLYGNTAIKMMYSSMHSFSKDFKKNTIRDGINDYGRKFAVGLGVIAKGIKGSEPLLAPEQLEEDLSLCKNVNEVIIFRLGGLNKDYIKAIKKFA